MSFHAKSTPTVVLLEFDLFKYQIEHKHCFTFKDVMSLFYIVFTKIVGILRFNHN